MNSAQNSEVALVGTGLEERTEASHSPTAPPRRLPDLLQRKKLVKRFRASRGFHLTLHKKEELDTHTHIQTTSWAGCLRLLPDTQQGSEAVLFLLVFYPSNLYPPASHSYQLICLHPGLALAHEPVSPASSAS